MLRKNKNYPPDYHENTFRDFHISAGYFSLIVLSKGMIKVVSIDKIGFLPLNSGKQIKKVNASSVDLKTNQGLGLSTYKSSLSSQKALMLCFSGQKNLTLAELKKISPEQSDYINSLVNKGIGQTIFPILKDTDSEHIKDFIDVSGQFKIENPQMLKAMAELSVMMKDDPDMKFAYAAEIRDGEWFRDILDNKFHPIQDKKDTLESCSIKPYIGEIIKNSNLFIHTDDTGNVFYEPSKKLGQRRESKAPGLFTNDTQFVDEYKLSILQNGQEEELSLVKANNHGAYSERLLKTDDNTLSLIRRQAIDKAFFEQILAENNSTEDKTLQFDISSRVQDIFAARGCCPKEEKPYYQEGNILNTRMAPDRDLGVQVGLTARILDSKTGETYEQIINPEISEDNHLTAKITLPPQTKASIDVRLLPLISEYEDNGEIRVKNQPFVDGRPVSANQIPVNISQAMKEIQNSEGVKAANASIPSENKTPLEIKADKVINRSLNDIKLLKNVLYLNGNGQINGSNRTEKYEYVCAGLPRYGCLFGRDSIITAKFMVPVDPELAKGTIKILAKFQGKPLGYELKQELQDAASISSTQKQRILDIIGKYEKAESKKAFQSPLEMALEKEFKANKDKYSAKTMNFVTEAIKRYKRREEAVGKIPHELRVGEFSRQKRIEHTPFYGTFDATPLWLGLVNDYYKWTGDKQTIKELMPNIENALSWINKNSQHDNPDFDGFMAGKIDPKIGTAILNQDWKDSEKSAKHVIKNGQLATPTYPIVYSEIQGYVYEAKKGIAKIYRDLGNDNKANQLEKEAEKLKSKFNEKFWFKYNDEGQEKEYVAMAIYAEPESGKSDLKHLQSITSNPGHCLASGIIDEGKNSIVQETLMSDKMYSGWGIRTLKEPSEKEKINKDNLAANNPAYNALSYHNGSVWPHDNAMAGLGIGSENAARLTRSLIEAAYKFPNNRIPEVLSGAKREEKYENEREVYPETCFVQAWSSAGMVSLMLSSLGLKPDEIKNKDGSTKKIIRLENPMLPEGMNNIRINGIQAYGNKFDIQAKRIEDNKLDVKAYISGTEEELPVSSNNKNFTVNLFHSATLIK